MTRDVVLTRTAERQLNAAVDWYAGQNPEVADDWFNGLLAAISDIAKYPERFGLAHENDELPFEFREMRYGLGKRTTHRVL